MTHGFNHAEHGFERHRRQGIIDAVGDLLTGTTGRGVAGQTTVAVTSAAATTSAAVATTAAPVPTTAATTTAAVASSTRAVTTTAATTTSAAETTTSATTSDTETSSRARTTTALVTAETSTALVVVSGGTQAFGTGATGLSSLSATSTSTSLAKSDDSSSGPSTGTVVGIVAGALVGVIILATIIGYLYRQKWGRRDEPEDSPFDRDDFRRESVLLDDGNYDNGGRGSPQMSQYNNGGLGRSNSSLPGLSKNGSGPRPPTTLMNHYNHQQMMPSFQPGQVVPTSQGGFAQPSFGGGYGGSPPPMELYGGYPMAPGQQHQLDRGLYQPNPYAVPSLSHSPPQIRQAPQYYPQQATLERNPSFGSAYSSTELPLPPLAHSNPSSRSSHGDERPLSLVKEESEPTYSRSGTPTNNNVQQSYFSHRHNESASSQRVRPVSDQTSTPSYETGYARGEGNLFGRPRTPVEGVDVEEEKARRSQRTLSVRNGGLDADEDPYGGYA